MIAMTVSRRSNVYLQQWISDRHMHCVVSSTYTLIYLLCNGPAYLANLIPRDDLPWSEALDEAIDHKLQEGMQEGIKL